jgi:hypothetical protein
MKTIQEKAKAYDEAIERARKVLLDCTPEEQKVVEYISPELKESSDEEIRKALIRYHKSTIDIDGIKGDEIVSWLEKLSEQKSAWSGEDEAGLGDALWAVQQARTLAKDENDMGNLWYAEKWLNSLKGRLQPN